MKLREIMRRLGKLKGPTWGQRVQETQIMNRDLSSYKKILLIIS